MKASVASLEKKLALLLAREDKGAAFLHTATELAWRIRERDNIRAMELAEEVLTRAQQQEHDTLILRALLTVGYCTHHRSSFAEAFGYYEKALFLSNSVQDTPATAEALNGCVAACIKRREYDKAHSYARKAEELLISIDTAELRGDIFRSMGAVAFVQDNLQQALQHFTQAVECYTSVRAQKKMGIMYFNIGLSYKQLSNYPRALEYLNRSLAYAQKYRDSETLALSLIRLCSTYTDLGDYTNALDTSRRGYEYARKHGIVHIMVSALEQRGIAFSSAGDYTKALECYEESLRLRKQMQDSDGRLISLGNMAAVYVKLGEYQKALDAHNEILHSAQERHDKQRCAVAYVNISEVQNLMGRHNKALHDAEQSLAIFESIGDKRGVGAALQSMGKSYIHAQDYTRGIHHFQKALAMFREMGFLWGQSSVLTSIANAVLDAIGKEDAPSLPSANEWLGNALNIAREINAKEQIAAIYQSYAAWHEHMGNIAQAFAAFKEYHRIEKELRMEEAAKTISILETRLALEESERRALLHQRHAQSLEQQVELKQRELTAMAMQRSQANDFLQKFRRRVEQLPRTEEATTLRQDLDTLLREAQSALGTQQMWSAFEQQFQQLHSSFLHALASRYPTLTETERRVCALIKLQLNTKQIASTLNISQRTAEHHRLSIRRKVGLGERGNLGSLLATIE